MGLNSLCSNHEKEYTLILLSNILGGGASSILFQKLREEMGLCYSAFCYPMAFRNVGLNTISMAVNIFTINHFLTSLCLENLAESPR